MSSRYLELCLVVALVAVITWQLSPVAGNEVVEPIEEPSLTTVQPVPDKPSPSSLGGRYSLDGHLLYEPVEPGESDSPPTELEYENDRLVAVRGQRLYRNGSLLISIGEPREKVKEALGKPIAFSHGGHYWGYWGRNRGLDDPRMGILIEFSERGVKQISMHRDWSALASQLMLAGGREPVDGSDGYADLREWAGSQR